MNANEFKNENENKQTYTDDVGVYDIDDIFKTLYETILGVIEKSKNIDFKFEKINSDKSAGAFVHLTKRKIGSNNNIHDDNIKEMVKNNQLQDEKSKLIYEIVLDKSLENASYELKYKSMMHELYHILNKDIINCIKNKMDPNLNNIACDLIINYQLNFKKLGDKDLYEYDDFLTRLKEDLNNENIHYEKKKIIKNVLENLPEKYTPSSDYIYNAIKELYKNKNGDDRVFSFDFDEIIIDDGIDKKDLDDLESISDIIKEKIKEEIKKRNINIKDIIPEFLEWSEKNTSDVDKEDIDDYFKNIELPEAKINNNIIRIINSVNSYFNVENKERKRTYRRERLIPELKGISKIPTKKIGITIDASGSVCNIINDFISIAGGLSKKYSLNISTFSDIFHDYKDDYNSLKKLHGYGGCTYGLDAAKHAVKNKFDVFVIATDGYLSDIEEVADTLKNFKGKIIVAGLRDDILGLQKLHKAFLSNKIKPALILLDNKQK